MIKDHFKKEQSVAVLGIPKYLPDNGKAVHDFCEEEFFHDPECFKIATMSGGIPSLWQVWDTTGDWIVTPDEF
jgi:hypothetical protein